MLFAAFRLRDRATAAHCRAVARHARRIGAALGLSPQDREILETAALLHDIGKLALPAVILTGSHPLSASEWQLVRAHPADGARLLAEAGMSDPVVEAVRAHHERFDGGGYPHELAGDAIPLAARIISVADAYDVMTTRRPYHAPVSSAEAIAELRHSAGTQFDPEVAEAFIALCTPGVYLPAMRLAA